MPEISPAEIKHLAKLSRLTLTEDQEKQFASQLPHILNFVDTVTKVSKGKDEVILSPIIDQAQLRDDIVDSISLSKDDLKKLSPNWQNDQIEVPEVFTENADD